MVKAIVGLARGLGMPTVAEFVESREVYDELAGLGVDLAQGYHLGRPEQLRALLARTAATAAVAAVAAGLAPPAPLASPIPLPRPAAVASGLLLP